jgi:serine/threonine-protein kinase
VTRLGDAAIARLTDAATRPALPPDRYEIRQPLGRGGMGTVYAAYDRRLDRDVAIKVSNAAARTSELEARLRQEAAVLARLEHPGIVPVHDAGELEDGRWFYVMKYVRGVTLPQHASGLGEDEAAILGVFERIADTVAFAHAAGVVHRDLKPSNVMVGPFGEVLVLDWGVARIIHGDAGEPDGTRLGTPGFMAPELQRGESATAGPPADVYSLGAILYWLLVGVDPPPEGGAVAGGLRARQPSPSRRLRAIVSRCLADAPGDRYPDAAALGADLARYRSGVPVLAHPESALERAARFVQRYQAFVLLVLAYLVMRALFVWLQHR